MTPSASPLSPKAEFLDAAPPWLPGLIARSLDVDGQQPFSDQALVGVRTGARRVLALGEIGVAVLSSTEAELAVNPDARGYGHGTALLEAVVSHARPGLLVWAHGDHPAARALAASHGFVAIRALELWATHRVAATAAPTRLRLGGLTDERNGIRPFRQGTDEPAWLALNARAFAAHPEQGRVTRADLDELFAEPWFDPDDFLLSWHGDALVGYCWLKVTGEASGQSGEFYVVGVDPAHQGEGLGRRLVRAGLSRLHERGISTATLYVEADNEPALALYRSFGFEQKSIDVQYRWGS